MTSALTTEHPKFSLNDRFHDRQYQEGRIVELGVKWLGMDCKVQYDSEDFIRWGKMAELIKVD